MNQVIYNHLTMQEKAMVDIMLDIQRMLQRIVREDDGQCPNCGGPNEVE